MITLSHSDISNYLRCRRKFHWSFLLDYTPPDKQTGALRLGERVHQALEAHYSGENALAMYEAICTVDAKALDEADASMFTMDQFHDDVIVGRHCVEAYLDWLEEEGPDHGYAVDGVEDHIEADFLGGRVRLRGKVDVRFLRESDEAIVIDDFKTTGFQFGYLRDELERSYQHRIYLMIQRELERLRGTAGRQIGGARYTLLKKVTRKQRGTPMIERFDVPGILRSAEIDRIHILAICQDIIRMADRMGDGDETETFAYPSPMDSCRFCDYRVPCLIIDDIPDAGLTYLDDHFTRGRHKRYDLAPVAERHEGEE